MNYKEKEHFRCRLQRMIIPWIALLLLCIVHDVCAQIRQNACFKETVALEDEQVSFTSVPTKYGIKQTPNSKMPMKAESADEQSILIPDELIIEDYTLRAWHYRYNGNEWAKYSKGQYKNNDEVLNIKIGFDGKDVYIQGFFNRYIPDAWVKGLLSDDESTITFQTQYYGTDYNGNNRFFFGYTIGNDNLSGDVVFQYDKETSTLVLPSTMEIADCINEDTFYGSDYYRWIVITKGYQEQESVVVAPDGLHLEDYSFSASVVTYDENDNIIETPSTFGIKVGFDDNDVYIKGLCQLMPDSWIKGTLANGKLMIPANQYMGYTEQYEVFMTGFPVHGSDRMELEDIIFDYDSDAKIFSGGMEQFLVVNSSKVRIYYFTEYMNITITRQAEQSVKPVAPQMVDFLTYENTKGYGYLRFNQPLTDIYGNALLEDILYYQILVDDEHNINGYTFSPSRYETLESELSMIPYSFIDNHYFDVVFNYDTRVTDKIVYIKEEEPFTKNRIGLRTVYYGGGIENVSDTTWYFIREFADVLAMNEARLSLSEEIERASVLLNDSTKAKGKDVLLSAINSASQILTEITTPADIGIINQAIDSLKEAEEAYISLNQMIDPQEWVALQSFYQASNIGEGWTEKWDFSSNVPSVKTLPGVTAYDGHVTKIDIPGNKISGTFPVVLLSLPKLEYLNLSNNAFSGDIGMAVATYVSLNTSAQIALGKVNISGNQFAGNIGLFAACCPNLKELDASSNCLEDVYPIIPSTVTTLDISKQTIARVVPLHLANLSVDSIATKVPSILLYDHANQTFTPNINLLCTTPDNTWGMTMSYQNGALSIPYVSEQNAYYGESGDTLNVAVLYNNGSREGSTFRITLSFDEGDGNFDGKVNILDLQTTLNYMFEEYTNKPYNFTASNLWKDEVINVQDAVTLVNMLLDADAAPVRQQNAARRVAEQASEVSASVTVENGYLTIYSAIPVSAFDIIVSTSQQAEVVSALNDLGFTCTYKQSGNNLHLVGYSLNGSEISAGETAICELSNGIVSSAMLADREAKEISISLNGSTTTGVQSTIFNPSSQEVYRIPLGARRAIIIDKAGRKTLIKDEK